MSVLRFLASGSVIKHTTITKQQIKLVQKGDIKLVQKGDCKVEKTEFQSSWDNLRNIETYLNRYLQVFLTYMTE